MTPALRQQGEKKDKKDRFRSSWRLQIDAPQYQWLPWLEQRGCLASFDLLAGLRITQITGLLISNVFAIFWISACSILDFPSTIRKLNPNTKNNTCFIFDHTLIQCIVIEVFWFNSLWNTSSVANCVRKIQNIQSIYILEISMPLRFYVKSILT